MHSRKFAGILEGRFITFRFKEGVCSIELEQVQEAVHLADMRARQQEEERWGAEVEYHFQEI